MANKHSIMTREMVESFCDSYYIPDEVHPTAPGRDRTITQFPEGKVGVYTRLFDYCGYRIPLTKFFVSVLKYFRIHISQLSPFGAARISHFEVLTRVLELGPSVSVFRAFYTRMYSDGLFSFAKRSLSAPSCLSKPPDSIKNWADHFFWVDSRVFPISVPLYTGGVLEKDPAPHLTARQEQAVQILSSNKAPFRRYPECFLALVGLSPYYPFGENTYPAFERPDKTDMGLLDYIRTADPRKVQAVEVQKGEEQVTLFDSIKHCFVSLDAPAAAHQASGSGSGAGAEISAPSMEGNVVEENVIPEGAFFDLTDPECDVTVAEKDVAQRQPEKAKRKKLLKRSDPLPAKRLRTDHPSLASGTGGKSLASLRQSLPEGSLSLGPSSPAVIPPHVTVSSSCAADAPVYTTADIVTSSRGKTLALPTSGVGGSSQPETSEESTDSFYETAVLSSEDAKRWSDAKDMSWIGEMVESFCDSYYIPDEVHPTMSGRDSTITQFPEGKVGVYTRLFDYCGYRIPLTKFFVSVLKYFRIHISQLSPFGAARISHFEDPAPHLTARQEQAVQILSSNKAPFRRYPECFLSLMGLSPYYPFGENTYPTFERPDKTDMGLLEYIRTADPRKVQAVEVQKGEEQVTLLDSIKHCFVSLDAPAAAHQASGSGSRAGADLSAPSMEGNVVEENVIPEGAFLDLTDPECDITVVEKDVARKQPEKAKRKKLLKRSDPLPAKRLRTDHPSLASGTGGKSLANLRQSLPEGSLSLGLSSSAVIPTHVTVSSSCDADVPVYTTANIVTSSQGKTIALPTSGVGGSSQPEMSEESTDSFYETAVLSSEDAKRWYIPRWNITNDSLLDDGFSCRTLVDRVAPPGFFSALRNMDYDQLFEEFNVGAARQICLGSEVRSRAEHELELKEKLRGKYDARGVLLREKDAEIARLRSLLEEKKAESAEVPRLRDQVSALAADKSLLSAEVSALKKVVSQKDTDISLLDSRASYLKSALDDSQAACDEARSLISSLSSERDGLVSEVSTLHSAFRDFKEKMEAQQEEQAQELYNRVADLEAHVMDVSGRLEGEFYPAYLTALAGRKMGC
ncbi:hypothetical protein Tco_0106028 [Tanacetum coccineum]